MKKQMPDAGQPNVVKYIEYTPVGVRSQNLSRHAIGCVLSGTKFIHSGDSRRMLVKGDIFYLGLGLHYIEELPDTDRPFEQIVFYYSPEELQEILLHLNITYRLNITNKHSCSECRNSSEIVMSSWPALRSIFVAAAGYLHDEEVSRDSAADRFKMTELVYHIVSHSDCCLKSKVLRSIDSEKESFERTIHDNIFSQCSIEELARMTHRSLTSFKKEFRRIYDMPPHKWFIAQRLLHAKLLLLSTAKSISEVGILCSFPNTSHFIKLFKKCYGTTPVSFRESNRESVVNHTLLEQGVEKREVV